jgi:hypothetical protein
MLLLLLVGQVIRKQVLLLMLLGCCCDVADGSRETQRKVPYHLGLAADSGGVSSLWRNSTGTNWSPEDARCGQVQFKFDSIVSTRSCP